MDQKRDDDSSAQPRAVANRERGEHNILKERAVGLPEVIAFVIMLVALVSTGARRPRNPSSFRTDAGDVQLTGSGDIRLSAGGTLFEVVGRPGEGEEMGQIRMVRDARGVALEHIEIGAVVDGAPVRLAISDPHPTPQGPTHAVAHAELRGADAAAYDGELTYTLTRSPPSLSVSLKLRAAPTHRVALVMRTPLRRTVPFVPTTGMLADAGDGRGPVVVFEAAEQAAIIGGPTGELAVHLAAGERDFGSVLIAALTGPPAAAGEPARMFVLAAPDSTAAAEAAARLRKETVRKLRGRVVGGGAGIDVWGVGPEGRLLLHVKPGADGRFSAAAPASDVGFYATMTHTRASPIAHRAWNDDSELELTMLPGGEVHVRVEDFDAGVPLTARLIVHGLAPTADPNFGPDYRASGAGPLIDALHGDAEMPLPTGRYRVVATRGPEYTIDEQQVDVAPGSSQALRLSLRHVVDTPGWVGCDLHVHARPSFDAPVLPEDRVLSLVAAGINFAVPSEHNAVGNYDTALRALELSHDLASVPGVEITTYRPSLGHFNVFPYSNSVVPPYRHTTLKQLFTKARENDPLRILQVNHPRLTRQLGYFDIVGLDTKTGRAERDWRDDFDSLEVYNGADGADRARVEVVLKDWLRLLMLGYRYVATGDSDSHRIQYQWAGYPRTYVSLPREQAGDTGAPVDVAALIASLKEGHAFVTSGPIVEATVNGQGPGSTVFTPQPVARLHVVVRAAPWVDVSEVEVLLGVNTLARVSVPSHPTLTGSPAGDLAAASAAAVRFERDFDVPMSGSGQRFVVVVVRGNRSMDDVLPYMPIQPLAFTNPIWLARL
jgi:hypothetical protein